MLSPKFGSCMPLISNRLCGFGNDTSCLPLITVRALGNLVTAACLTSSASSLLCGLVSDIFGMNGPPSRRRECSR